MKLEKHEVVLDLDDVDHHDGVRFGTPIPGSVSVTLPFKRWLEMERPRQIKVTVEPVSRKPAF